MDSNKRYEHKRYEDKREDKRYEDKRYEDKHEDKRYEDKHENKHENKNKMIMIIIGVGVGVVLLIILAIVLMRKSDKKTVTLDIPAGTTHTTIMPDGTTITATTAVPIKQVFNPTPSGSTTVTKKVVTPTKKVVTPTKKVVITTPPVVKQVPSGQLPKVGKQFYLKSVKGYIIGSSNPSYTQNKEDATKYTINDKKDLTPVWGYGGKSTYPISLAQNSTMTNTLILLPTVSNYDYAMNVGSSIPEGSVIENTDNALSQKYVSSFAVTAEYI
jgi:hypothetical protein